ncbi:MAG: serine/threonine protein kinase [Cryobacterium sp.]|nr:serine/threonine protein kinase [Oligoflexia bacterium]
MSAHAPTPDESIDASKRFEIFGDYILLKLLAAGGMAEVFLARPSNPNANGRIVVIKRILKSIANDPVFIKMFRSEIRVTLGFNHPHTIQLHDFGEIDYQPYIAMEFIEGQSIREIITKFAERGETIPVSMTLGLLAQAASGLSYAHHFENTTTGEVVNAIHRDISPHNLIVSYDGNLKVIDFGIAKAKNEINDKTRAGQIKGKSGYLSLEQLQEKELDGRSDVFSLGIVAWEMLTSRRLFYRPGDTDLQMVQRIQNCEQHIVAPSILNPEIPAEVDEVILRALEKHRENRYPSAEAFQDALRKVMRKLYPNHTYADSAQVLRTLFEREIAFDRLMLRDANDAAQEVLALEHDAMTRVAEKEKQTGSITGFKPLRTRPKELQSGVEARMSKLEFALKQKASTRHMVMLTFYVVSIIGIKLDEKYSLLDRFLAPAQATEFAVSEPAVPPHALQPKASAIVKAAAAPVTTAVLTPPAALPVAKAPALRHPVQEYPPRQNESYHAREKSGSLAAITPYTVTDTPAFKRPTKKPLVSSVHGKGKAKVTSRVALKSKKPALTSRQIASEKTKKGETVRR